MKKLTSKSLRFIPAALCLVLCLLANPAGAQTVYWDNNGLATPTGGTWDTATPSWSTDPAGVDSGSLVAFPAGGLPVFCAGATSAGTIEVDVNTADLSVNGIYNNGIGGTPCALTLGGSGSLSLPSGMNTFYIDSTYSITVNIPINGTGGLQTGGSGTLSLFSPTGSGYSGGTVLASAALTYFNNDNAFGTGDITPALTGAPGYAALLSSGGSTITLPNNFVISTANAGINFASSANTPVICTGTWDLQQTLFLRNNGDSTAPLTLSGILSDVGGLTVSANNSGTILLSGANNYSGGTSLILGSSGVTLQLGNASALGTGATTIAGGCALDLNGNSVTVNLTVNGTGFSNLGALINNSGTPASISAGSTVTMGSVGQNDIGGTGDMTVNCGITSLANQAFAKVGTGTLTLNAANSFGTGQFILGGSAGAGTVAIGNASALGTGTFNINAAPATVRSADTTSYSFNNALTLGASALTGWATLPSIVFGAPGTGDLSFSGNANTGTSNDKTIAADGITVTFSGVISGNTTTRNLGFSYIGGPTTGTIVLSGANTYTKTNVLFGGKVRVAHSESANVSGPLGKQLANKAGNIVFYGGTLQYSSANNNDYSGRFATDSSSSMNGASQAYNIDVNGQAVTFASALTSSGGTMTLSDTAGGGTLTLSSSGNTYAGGTTINAGTLALSGSGSISSSVSISIAGGATFDVSGVNTALTLGSSQTLQAGGTSGSSATIATASGKGLTLGTTSPLNFTAYDGTTVPLTITGGDSLVIGTGNPVTVTTTTMLPVGSYKLIQAVTGTPATSVTVNGSGIVSGTFASLRITGGELYLDVQNLESVTQMGIAPGGGGNLTINYSGGAGAQFVLLQTNNITAPLADWTRLQTNTAASRSFTITPGSDPAEFYSIKSE